MRVVLSTWGKFHTFHLARQMERFGWLEAVLTSYPRFHLRKEGIPPEKILANPWFHLPLVAKNKYGLYVPALDRQWDLLIDRSQQSFIARNLPPCDIFIALSGSGLTGGRIAQQRGAKWICDRSSSHQKYSDDIMTDEYARYGVEFRRCDPWILEKELAEYRESDMVVVPSEFARRSFLSEGVDASRVTTIRMGSDLRRFRKVADADPEDFVVCYCGRLGFGKGIPYLLEAFHKLRHPRKRLILIGEIEPQIRSFLARANLDRIEILGHVRNTELSEYYSRAHVFVMPSLSDGWGLVQTEAMACGLPAISSENTGAADCITEGINGFVVPIRSSNSIAERLQLLADDPIRRAEMGANARRSVEAFKGWDQYGDQFRALCVQSTGLVD